MATMTEALEFAKLADTQRVIWSYTFVINNRKQHAKFAAMLQRILDANTPSVDWVVQEHPAILNTSYFVQATAPGNMIAIMIRYFAASGFPTN